MIRHTTKFLLWLEKKNIEIDEIDQQAIDEYLSVLYGKYCLNSMVPITANLRKFCKHFLKKSVEIKISRHSAPERDKTPLTEEEVKRMFDASQDNPLENAIIKTLYYTGIRCNELTSLNINDINFQRLQLTVRHGKGEKQRVVNMTKDCADAIAKWINARPSPKRVMNMLSL